MIVYVLTSKLKVESLILVVYHRTAERTLYLVTLVVDAIHRNGEDIALLGYGNITINKGCPCFILTLHAFHKPCMHLRIVNTHISRSKVVGITLGRMISLGVHSYEERALFFRRPPPRSSRPPSAGRGLYSR